MTRYGQRGLITQSIEIVLALLLTSAAGLGLWQLNRPLPNAETLLTETVPEDAVLIDARGSLSYRRGHLPGAYQLWSRDLLSFAGGVPEELAEPEAIADKLRALGLTENSRVVVYDVGDGQSAPLVLLVLRAFGIEAQLLEGGVTRWLEQGGEESRELPATPEPSQANFNFDDKLLVNAEESKLHLKEAAIAPIDTRDVSAYLQGHIETAVNIQAERLLPEGGLPRWSILHNQLERARITPDTHPLIYGAEIADAAQAWLALRAYGIKHIHVYRAPYEGLVEAGLPVSEAESIRAISTPSSSVCWR